MNSVFHVGAKTMGDSNPWHAAYPQPKATASTISNHELLQCMKSGDVPGKDFLLVDVRRSDHEGGTIKGSINLPAQSLHPSMAVLYQLVKEANVSRIIWYCGSSRGRGPRAAGWFADYLIAQNDSNIKSVTLEGGIKGWVAAGPKFIEYMDEYEASAW